MPIYAYRCCRCSAEFEELVLSASRAAEVDCPACDSGEVERRPAVFGIAGGSRSAVVAGGACAPAVGGG